MTRQQHIANRNNACLLVSNIKELNLSQASQWEYAMKRWQMIHEAQK